jgi:putative copper export protein
LVADILVGKMMLVVLIATVARSRSPVRKRRRRISREAKRAILESINIKLYIASGKAFERRA